MHVQNTNAVSGGKKKKKRRRHQSSGSSFNYSVEALLLAPSLFAQQRLMQETECRFSLARALQLALKSFTGEENGPCVFFSRFLLAESMPPLSLHLWGTCEEPAGKSDQRFCCVTDFTINIIICGGGFEESLNKGAFDRHQRHRPGFP